MATRGNQHVFPSRGGWSVRKTGAIRATRRFSTKADAVTAAAKIAQNQGTTLYIHGTDGRIQERVPYDGEPKQPRR